MPTKVARKKSGSRFAKVGWRDIQTETKIKKRSKLALGILAVVIGLLVVSWTIRFTQNLFRPWKLQTSERKNYIWNGEFNINLVVRSTHVSLLIFNPKQEKIVIINIPDETFLEVPHGFGEWQIRAVYELGQSKKELGGDALLKDTLRSLFAVPIDGFLDFSSLGPQMSAVEIVDELKKNTFSGFNFLSSLKTDLTLWELIRLKLGIRAVRFDKLTQLDLLKLNVLDRKNLLDGTAVLTADPIKLDSILSDLADPTIASEHKTIAVLNATEEPQLAGKWARLITNLGGNVIIITNAKKTLEKTQVVGDGSLTLKRLNQIFALDCQSNPKCDKISPEDEDLVSSRAQINLFLGKDYLNR